MLKTLIGVVLITLPLVAALSYGSPRSNYGAFDRAVVAEKFADSVYPDLKKVHGLILLRADEFHAAGTDNHIDIVPCHVGSGIPVGGPQAPASSPQCTGCFYQAFRNS